jgi:hypothetical protein
MGSMDFGDKAQVKEFFGVTGLNFRTACDVEVIAGDTEKVEVRWQGDVRVSQSGDTVYILQDSDGGGIDVAGRSISLGYGNRFGGISVGDISGGDSITIGRGGNIQSIVGDGVLITPEIIAAANGVKLEELPPTALVQVVCPSGLILDAVFSSGYVQLGRIVFGETSISMGTHR